MDSFIRQGIAIIGMAGRFPGAANVRQFWDNLTGGVESVRLFTDDELAAAGVDPGLRNHPEYVRSGTDVKDAEAFDAAFFGYTPREAEIMDPQQRVFLECVWHALENGGYDPGTYPGRIGLYAGSGMNSYLVRNLLGSEEVLREAGSYQLMLGNDKDHLTTRVAYKLNLRGPAVTVQTACSTSLVAVIQACRSLAAGECDMALAGGVSISFPQTEGYLYVPGMILSPDGHCRPFDAAARGTVPGKGAAVVLLKPLPQALNDGDFIYAVIRGAAANNDGSGKVGYSAPSVQGQEEVIVAAQEMAGFDPRSIGYVEAHGTGTELGDPIEVRALTSAFRRGTADSGFCALGSVKSNIGHLDVAAGAAGLIKCALTVHHGRIPATVHFKEPNPHLELSSSPFFVPPRTAEWNGGGPRRAGVSSFGIGGTNAHVCLESAPDPKATGPTRECQLLVLSAASETALAAARGNLAAHLERDPGVSMDDVAYTLQVGRRAFSHRWTAVCHDAGEAVELLRAQGDAPARTSGEPEVVFLFPGQGSQHPGMALPLYETQPVVRRIVDECAEILHGPLGLDLRDLLWGGSPDSAERLNETRYAQPALFVIEYALAKWWIELGIRPAALIGHSVGEYVAACLAGVFPLRDALHLVAERGRLMQSMAEGAMMSVPLSEADVVRRLPPGLEIAAVNGPAMTVVSGPVAAIEALHGLLTAEGVSASRLKTSHAFHSAAMEPILAEFEARVAAVQRSEPSIPIISNLTGKPMAPGMATEAGYWRRHLRHAVRFGDGVEGLLGTGGRCFLEVGPGTALTTLVRQANSREKAQAVVSTLPHPREKRTALESALAAVGRLWTCGARVNWKALHEGAPRRRTPLPEYPFQRVRHWVEPKPARAVTVAKPADLTRKELDDWFYIPSWRQTPPARVLASDDTRGKRVVILADGLGLSDRLASALAERGWKPVLVHQGAGFARRDDGSFEVDPRRPEHFDEVCSSVGGGIGAIVQLWGLAMNPGAGDAPRLREIGFYPLLWLLQACVRRDPEEALRVHAVVSGAFEVMGEGVLNPDAAVTLGLVKALPFEVAPFRASLIDIPAADKVDADALAAELEVPATGDVVAYRAGQRWVRGYEPVRLGAVDGTSPSWKKGGVYLITGGLGGIGLVLAEHLAGTCSARLILTARTPLPERERWDAVLAQEPEDHPVARRIRAVRRLEAHGSTVIVSATDAADRAAMSALAAEARARFGGIDGVLHAAGAIGNASIPDGQTEPFEEMFLPKVEGTRVVLDLFGNSEARFIVLFSSISTALGGMTLGGHMAGYVAANAFQDAVAATHDARNASCRVLVTNWDSWRETGMAVRKDPDLSDAAARRFAETTKTWVGSAEGVEALERIMAAGLPQVIVSTRDLNQRIASRRMTEPAAPAAGNAPSSATPSAGAAPSAPAAGESRNGRALDPVEAGIIDIWKDLMGVKSIRAEDDFFELGGHSLLGTQVLARVRSRFGVALPLRAIFEATTPAAMADLIRSSTAGGGQDPAGAPAEEGEREEIEL